jgi:hypothetical protein
MKPNKTCFVGLIALALGGCSNAGILSLHLTDAPPDTENMSTVLVTLASAEAHFAGGHDGDGKGKDDDLDKGENGGWVRVTGPAQTYDLLRLQNGLTELVGDLALPEGKITQIRLFIDEAGPNTVTLKDGRVCPLDLKDVDKTGIKITHPFKALPIREGRTLEVVLDFDLKESVDMTAPCVYQLKPVIKIKSVKE